MQRAGISRGRACTKGGLSPGGVAVWMSGRRGAHVAREGRWRGGTGGRKVQAGRRGQQEVGIQGPGECLGEGAIRPCVVARPLRLLTCVGLSLNCNDLAAFRADAAQRSANRRCEKRHSASHEGLRRLHVCAEYSTVCNLLEIPPSKMCVYQSKQSVIHFNLEERPGSSGETDLGDSPRIGAAGNPSEAGLMPAVLCWHQQYVGRVIANGPSELSFTEPAALVASPLRFHPLSPCHRDPCRPSPA